MFNNQVEFPKSLTYEVCNNVDYCLNNEIPIEQCCYLCSPLMVPFALILDSISYPCRVVHFKCNDIFKCFKSIEKM